MGSCPGPAASSHVKPEGPLLSTGLIGKADPCLTTKLCGLGARYSELGTRGQGLAEEGGSGPHLHNQ